MPTKWVLEADLLFLEPAADFAELSPNAIREYPGPNSVGALAYPAPFCRDATAWMRALSHLVARDREFSLYLVATRNENDPRELSRNRVYPGLDSDIMAFLREINEGEDLKLEEQSKRVQKTLNRMKLAANLSFSDELQRLYPEEKETPDG